MASVADPAAGIAIRKLTTIDLVGGIFCNICRLTFSNKKEYDSHYSTHNPGSKEMAYTCVACYSTFNNYPSFRGHCYTNHVIKGRFRCKNCDKAFSKFSALKEHTDTVHNFKCNKPECNQQFPSKNELRLHQILHKNEANKPPFQCQTCNKEIDNIANCEDHIDEHCMFTYNCPICNETITKDDASKHLNKHFDDSDVLNSEEFIIYETPEDSSINIIGGIRCCYCKTLHKNRVEIDTHFAEVHANKEIQYTCNICSKQYTKYALFGDHCYYHYSKNRFMCESCDKTFPRLSLLVLHAEECGRGDAARGPGSCDRPHQPEYACPEPDCAEVFPHRLQAAGRAGRGRAGRCRRCGLALGSRAAAARHLLVHRHARYCCPVCARRYHEKYLLMKHIPQHFEAVFHMCKICAKTFNARNRLIEHIKTHSTVKSYECKHCGKGFIKPYQLSQHLNIHTGARPFHCSACPKTFASLPNCRKHMLRMHHIDKKFKQILESPNNISDIDTKKIPEVEEQAEKEIKKDELGSDESTMDSVIIDTSIVERETQSYKEVVFFNADNEAITELTNILPNDFAFGMADESAPPVPCEYGPDFSDSRLAGAFLDRDDPLPHINPQLLSRAPLYRDLFPPQDPPPPWEPIITKVCGSYFGELDLAYDADIF